MKNSILKNIDSPKDLRKLTNKELPLLARELRTLQFLWR